MRCDKQQGILDCYPLLHESVLTIAKRNANPQSAGAAPEFQPSGKTLWVVSINFVGIGRHGTRTSSERVRLFAAWLSEASIIVEDRAAASLGGKWDMLGMNHDFLTAHHVSTQTTTGMLNFNHAGRTSLCSSRSI